jgi:hypothetical protein
VSSCAATRQRSLGKELACIPTGPLRCFPKLERRRKRRLANGSRAAKRRLAACALPSLARLILPPRPPFSMPVRGKRPQKTRHSALPTDPVGYLMDCLALPIGHQVNLADIDNESSGLPCGNARWIADDKLGRDMSHRFRNRRLVALLQKPPKIRHAPPRTRTRRAPCARSSTIALNS